MSSAFESSAYFSPGLSCLIPWSKSSFLSNGYKSQVLRVEELEGRVREDAVRRSEVGRTHGFRNQHWRITGMALSSPLLTLEQTRSPAG